ncbi:putative RNA methyltransferase [Alteromonas sp. CYL-A6]|uniref:putative RNA methyltransferase n=1 Tax=Alteromonas nitratireducens TaxID=3390813 RepID=UPI0034B6EDF6
MWQCPLCQHPLTTETTMARCENGHTFDRARSGYFNLLPVQFKKSRSPGDDKTMLTARRQFHSSDGYLPLKRALLDAMVAHWPATTPDVLFESGCGEGSYLAYLREGLIERGITVSGAGCDIAKPAVEMASKAFRENQFVVASNVNLPVADGAVGAMLQVFAPGSTKEYHRVIAPGGLLITVDPGPAHLSEIKQRVYREVRPHTPPDSVREGFVLKDTQTVGFTLNFSSEAQKQALLTMTPYYWRVPENDMATRFCDLTAVTADFVIQFWQRNP